MAQIPAGRAVLGRGVLALLSLLLLVPKAARADPAFPVGPDHKVQVYKLETLELTGTTRMSAAALAEELALVPGIPLNDELVMSTRARLLGLGLFKSAILVMHKGTKPGLAQLVVEVEDDNSVLTDWALGGELGVTIDQQSVPALDSSSTPMDYRLNLIGRNLFNAMHRGSVLLDIDSVGRVREGQLAYGLPRFAREGAQFDAGLSIVDPYHRYLDALGFGGRGQGLWTRPISGTFEIEYGAAMYVNKGPDFAVTGFPQTALGPKVAFYKEGRLRGFFPGAGNLIGASVLANVTAADESIIELNLAKTWALREFLYTTIETHALTVGAGAYAFRAEARLDVPLGKAAPDEDQAELFLRLRGGKDSAGTTNLVGSDAIVGVRYHSSGFIAEFALKVTRSPQELAPKSLAPPTGEAP